MKIKKATTKIKEKFISGLGSITGLTSLLGSWQVCHNLCLGIITLLGIIGITVAGMPLLFLTKIALPLWIIAFILLLVAIIIQLKMRCISNSLILINSGLIIAGMPFQSLQKFYLLLWLLGGGMIFVGIILLIKDKLTKKKIQ